MKYILLSVLFVYVIEGVTANDLHFAVLAVTKTLCSDVQIGTVIDKHEAVGGIPPRSYTLNDDYTIFNINKENGVVKVARALSEKNAIDIVLNKHVTDKNGAQAEIVINITLAKPFITAKACPKIQELRVREIAPVGEEVDLVECISNIIDTDLLRAATPLSVSSRGVSSTDVPFNITPEGVVVVSDPLVYRNNIQDIHLVNVTFLYLKDGGDPSTNCNRTKTKVTVKIIVERSDCQTNWTYELKRNLYLAIAPVVSLPQSTAEDCMSVCTANETLVCHGFNYNVVKKECLLLNETEFTQVNMTKRRMGMFLYRKVCKTDSLPAAVLRNAVSMIENATTLGINMSADVLGNLLPAVKDSRNTSIQDAVLTSIIFLQVVNKTDLGNATKNNLEEFLKVCGQLFDSLLSKTEYFDSNQKTKMARILTVFDTLIESLSHCKLDGWSTLSIRSEMTAFVVQRLLCSQSHNSAIGSHTSRSGFQLNFSWQNKTGDYNRTTLFTGAISGLENIVTPFLVRKSTDKRRLALKGQVISVVLEPAPTEPFEILLDISAGGSGEKYGSRICVFLQKESYRYSPNLWNTDGCRLVTYNSSHTRCRCSHTTNFAVLMQVTKFQLEEVHVASLEILTIIGCCISIAALTTTVAVLLWFRLRSERYTLLLHLSVAVILAQVVFLTGIDAVQVKIACRLVAILLHYLYLSVFTLMLAEGIHLFHKLHRAFDADNNLNMLLFLGWGSPFVIVSLSLLTAGDGYSTPQHCWLSTDGAIWAFVGPALTIIAINMAILIIIIRTFLGVTIVAKKTDMQKFKASLKATVVLLPLLGITWMFGVVAVNKSTVVFQYIFAILNSLQGLFIFLFHVVFNEDVKKACSDYKRNQITSVDSLPQSSTTKKLHKKANLYSTTTSL